MPLRNHVRVQKVKTFLAVCWDMVLPPRMRFPSRRSIMACFIARSEKPLCCMKRLSSLAIQAIVRFLEISSSDTHFLSLRGVLPSRID